MSPLGLASKTHSRIVTMTMKYRDKNGIGSFLSIVLRRLSAVLLSLSLAALVTFTFSHLNVNALIQSDLQ